MTAVVVEAWARPSRIEQRAEGAVVRPDGTLYLTSEFVRFIVAVCPECGEQSPRVAGSDTSLSARRQLYPWCDEHQEAHNRERGLIT